MRALPFAFRPSLIVPAGYLIDEHFESGITPANWTVDAGSFLYNYASPALAGSYSLRTNSTDALGRFDFTGQTDVWVRGKFRVRSNWVGAISTLVGFATSANVALASLRLDGISTISVRLYANGSDSAASGYSLSADTTYWFWLHFLASGTCQLFISPSSTRPTVDNSGGVVLSKTGGSGTISRLMLRSAGSGTGNIFDEIQVSTAELF